MFECELLLGTQRYSSPTFSIKGDVQTKAGCKAIVEAIAEAEDHVRLARPENADKSGRYTGQLRRSEQPLASQGG